MYTTLCTRLMYQHHHVSRVSARLRLGGVLRRIAYGVCTADVHDENISMTMMTTAVTEASRCIGTTAISHNLAASSSSFLLQQPQQPSVDDTNSSQWTCVCGFKNYAFRDCCFGCKAVRVGDGAGDSVTYSSHDAHVERVGVSSTSDTASAPVSSVAADWASRPRSRPDVLGGVSGRAASSGDRRFGCTEIKSFRHGDWMCGCGEHNFAKRESCWQCGTPRLVESAVTQDDGLSWERGRSRGSSDAAILSRVRHDRAAATPQQPSTVAAYWTCLACHSLQTHHDGVACTICGTPRSAVDAEGSSASHSANSSAVTGDGDAMADAVTAGGRHMHNVHSVAFQRKYDDWNCPECHYLNFASRVVCKQCKAKRTQPLIFTDTMLSRGSSVHVGEMWTCECGYRNFGSRNKCRECGSSCPGASMH